MDDETAPINAIEEDAAAPVSAAPIEEIKTSPVKAKKEKRPAPKKKIKKIEEKKALPIKKIKPSRKDKTVSLRIKRDIEAPDKILLGVSKRLSKIVGVDINIIRALFLVSSVLIIGIPIYFILALVLKD